jgi:hypothetical protein
VIAIVAILFFTVGEMFAMPFINTFVISQATHSIAGYTPQALP